MIHVNPKTGNTGVCRAVYQCPFGEDAPHFDTTEEARAYYEESMAAETFSSSPVRGFSHRTDLSEELIDDAGGSFFDYKGVSFEDDWNSNMADVTVGTYRGDGSLPKLEFWHEPATHVVHASIKEGSNRLTFEYKLAEDDINESEGRLTPKTKAAVVTDLMKEAEKAHPAIFDRGHPAYKKREELLQEIEDNEATLNGVTLHNTHSIVPRIWESHDVSIPGVEEVYMHERNGTATLRVLGDDGNVSTIYSESVPEHEWTKAQMATFFTKAHDALISYEAHNL